MAPPKLLLVDGHALAYRAYYAIPNLRNSRGEPTGAIFGFIKTLRKWLADHQPTHLVVAFDLGTPERLKELPTYKSQRPPTPPDLNAQLPQIKEWLAASHIPVLEREGHEADDIIASLVARAVAAGWDCLIASSDKDFAQLVDDHTKILKPDPKGKTEAAVLTDAAAVRARFGVAPSQIVDYLALLGDTSDNIPGIEGIGPKTAAKFIAEFGDIETLLHGLDKIPNPVLRERIAASAALLHRNRALVTLRTNVPIEIKLDSLQISPPDAAALIAFYEQREFKTLLAEARAGPQTTQQTLL